MTITIEVDNREDFEWLQPFLERLSQKNNIRLNYSLQEKKQKIESFLDFVHQNPLKVSKLIIPNHEERNER